MSKEINEKQKNSKNPIISSVRNILLWIIIFLVLNSLYTYYNSSKVIEKNYSELVSGINNEEIKEIEVSYNKEVVTYKIDDKTDASVNIPTIDGLLKDIEGKIKENKVNIKQEGVSASELLSRNLVVIIPSLIFITILLFIISINNQRRKIGQQMSEMGGKDLSFGKSKARLIDVTDNPEVKFNDVAGIDEEKEELQEIVDFLKNPEKYTNMGARIPKGVLLYGRPGTGKTLLAKAVAGEAQVPFYTISGSDFVEMYVGVGAKRVREMFIEAKKNSPCIIFIDEIDAVGRQRGAGLGGGHDEREQTLNQLLVEMDGFGKNEGVIVIAATNRPDVLDSALLRAGRFDRQITVSMPDAKAREQILKVHAKSKKLDENVDLSVIAKNTSGFAGADLENILNEAALLAARKNNKVISNLDIEEAMIKVSMGPEKKSRVISEKERKLVSYHEAGHAVSSYFLETQEKVHEISIVPRGMAGGYTMYKSSEDKSYISKKEMEENLVSLLGGRIAEEIILGDISTGASNDIDRVSKIARDMVTRYGMSKNIGAISYQTDQGQVFLGRDIAHSKNMSEKTAAVVDEEVKQLVDTAYRVCKEILEQNTNKLHAVAKVLMEKEKITGEEFIKIMEEEN